MKILVAEDSKSTNQMMVDSLTSDEHEVISVFNGTDALRIIFKELPDIIFLDVIMPGIDGRDICEAIKNTSHTKKIQIVITSGKDSQLDQKLYLELGADDFLSKPFDKALLNHYLQKAIRRIKTDSQPG